ncbi:MAG: glutamate racemase [Phaeodactylibacter sp.]|nr:glutamate racemase [Phaeodactylibacter sp.]
MHPAQPIGIFDSGIGGLTIAKAIHDQLPQESIIYFGDTAHLPYGDKSGDAIRYFSLRIVKFLLDQNCKMIVVACNTASAAAYHVLLEFFKGRALFVNVVDPLVEATAQKNFSKVGVIATKATISTGTYEQQLKRAKPELRVHSLATPLLVPMIEEGFIRNEISQKVIDSYLSDPGFADIEALLLACTHYPLIKAEIQQYFKHEVAVMDSTDVVTVAVERSLQGNGLLNVSPQQNHRFYVSDYTSSFEATTRFFYGEGVHLEHCPIW